MVLTITVDLIRSCVMFMNEDLTLSEFYSCILLRYSGEIMIKSKRVRQRFIDQIVKVSKRVLARTGVDEPRIIITRPRIYIPIKEEFDLEALNSLLATVPGVVSFSYFKPIILDHDVLRENIILLGKRILKKGNSFAVRVSREGEHDFTSQELAAKLGGFILDEFNNIDLHVDLNNPDITFFVEVRHQNVAIYHDKYEGTGGIPKDISSPIIAITTPSDRSWLSVQELLKRGVKVFYLTYYDFINTSCDYDSRVAMLNKDDKIISKMFELFSFQDKNTIKVGILPISKKIREYCKKYGVDLDHISNQTILALISSFLLLKETYARDDAEHPLLRRFEGSSCDWIYSNV